MKYWLKLFAILGFAATLVIVGRSLVRNYSFPSPERIFSSYAACEMFVILVFAAVLVFFGTQYVARNVRLIVRHGVDFAATEDLGFSQFLGGVLLAFALFCVTGSMWFVLVGLILDPGWWILLYALFVRPILLWKKRPGEDSSPTEPPLSS